MAYERPMVTVDQNMTIKPTSVERDQPAFIFGPNYELHRYSDADEKANSYLGEYKTDGNEFTYPKVINPDKVDLSGYTKLYGDNVVVKLFDIGSAKLVEEGVTSAEIAENGGYTKLLFEGKRLVSLDMDGEKGSLESLLKRDIEVGDTIRVSYKENGSSDDTVRLFSVSKVEYSKDAWDINDDSSSDGAAGTIITIGDAIPDNIDTNSVNAVLVGVMDGVEFERKDFGSKSGGYLWEEKKVTDKDGQKVNGISVNAGLKANAYGYGATDDYYSVLSADLYVTYRELLTTLSDGIHNVSGTDNLEILGTIDKDNPLAMGVYMAALNAASDDGDESPVIYYMAVPSDDLDGYNNVLKAATHTDSVYVLAPVTSDEDVLAAVKSHVVAMSAKDVKMWRIAVASSKADEGVYKLDSSISPTGRDFLAIPVSDDGIATGAEKYNKFRIVKSVSDKSGNANTDLRSTISEGDKVLFHFREDAWGEETPDEYIVERVLNNYTVQVKGKINVDSLNKDSDSYRPIKVEIYHEYTDAQLVPIIAANSRNMASRRMINVFPNSFKMNGVTLDGMFAACAVAGRISSTEPQQPITNMSINGIDDVPLVYNTFSAQDLDDIAAGGTFIIAQDLPGDKVYVRHQITTAYPDGNLNTGELSITRNVDSISYAFADLFKPYYGKYNVTPELVAILENLAGQLISQLGGVESVYGPQLITDETEIKYVRQNELYKDHVDIAISLGVPYPCNNIDIVLTV